MRMEHHLTAYDRETDDFLSFVLSVPDAYLQQVREIARVEPTDPEAAGSYPLSNAQAHAIAKLLDKPVELQPGAVFFLEPAALE
jgi:hypothetical protein